MNEHSLSLSFAGTPAIAAAVLESLLEHSRHKINHVYTQPDRPAGRGRKTVRGPVKLIAQKYDIPVKQPTSPRELELDDDLNNIDALIVVAYGLILPAPVLSRPERGCINVHMSLLPRWRGAAPIQRALQAGDAQTGVSIMLMDTGIDTGKIMLQESCDIAGEDTGASLAARLATLGSQCLLKALSELARGSVHLVEQNEKLATYANKITKQEAEIDWNTAAEQVERNIRAFNPTPVAFTKLNGVKIRVWNAKVIESNRGNDPRGEIVSYTPQGLDISTKSKGKAIRILELQLEGKKKQAVREFYNGHPGLF